MKMPILSALLIVLTVFLSQLVSASESGEWVQSLDGTWSFTVDPEQAKADGTEDWDSIDVPGNWDALPDYWDHFGIAWYRRTFIAPADWESKHVRLRFEAVNDEAVVTLNGRTFDKHIGGFTPFEFEVNDILNFGGENTVTVQADNRPGTGAWWRWGGISRSVNLIANNDARIVWQHIHADPDLETGNAQVTVRYKIINTSAQPLEVTIKSQVAPDKSGSTAEKITPVAVSVPGSSEVVLSTEFAMQDVNLWHFDHTHLYRFESVLLVDGKPMHSKSDRFGIRKVAVTSDGLYLNGERIRVPGFNRVSDTNDLGNTEPDELVRKDVDMMKRAGAVFSRITHNPQAPNLLHYLDEKGMLVICEIPVWAAKDRNIRADNPVTQRWLTTMIERDFNHPSIIGWSVGNEMRNHYDYVRTMSEYVRKELDPHRLVVYASYTAWRDEATPENDPVGYGDVALVNRYAPTHVPHLWSTAAKTVRSRWPDKPVYFSEFGSTQIGASLDAEIDNIDGIWAAISSEPYVIGGGLWTFNDYRSRRGFKNIPASGNREWGVVDVERRPKAAYHQIRRIWSPVRSLTVVDGFIRIEPRSTSEIPSFTLRGYKVHYTIKDPVDGRTITTGEIPVPDLVPDSPVWTAPVPGATAGHIIEASLFSPTGYSMIETE
jgi:beta-galactosidase